MEYVRNSRFYPEPLSAQVPVKGSGISFHKFFSSIILWSNRMVALPHPIMELGICLGGQQKTKKVMIRGFVF